MDKELTFAEAIMTVKNALDALTVTGSSNARILVCACDDLATIADSITLYMAAAKGGKADDSEKDPVSVD